MKNCFNEEGFEFLEAVGEFVRAVDPVFQYNKAKRIIETFLIKGVDKEVNVDEQARKRIKDVFDKTEAPTDSEKHSFSEHLFNPLFKLVRREIRMDTFPRYIRSDYFIDFAEKKGEEFIRKISIDLRRSEPRNAVMFQPTDFTTKQITDRDIQFILRLAEDSSDWESLIKGSNLNHYCYTSKTDYSIGGLKGLKLGKMTGILPYHVDDVIAAYNNKNLRHYHDRQYFSLDQLKREVAGDGNDHMYSNTASRYILKFAPLMKKRCMNQMNTMVYDCERECYVLITKTSTNYSGYKNEIGPDEDMVEGVMIGGYVFFKIDGNRTRYVHMGYADFKLPELLSKTIFKKLVVKRAKLLYTGIMKACEEHKKGSVEVVDNTTWTLEDFKKRFSEENGTGKTWNIDNNLI
ncbi:hypothetical protein AKO1_012477 [Acrasis kona]|uniref:RGS domain-containing protein n=1 Tax=Acrasis kona TaxID=1008807 RepID=A0AAW2YYB1_9EUKA